MRRAFRVLVLLIAALGFLWLLDTLGAWSYHGRGLRDFVDVVTSVWFSGSSRERPAMLIPRVERVGPAPARVFAFDPRVPGRVYAGAWVSDDGGRHWRPLIGNDGRLVTLLGGQREVPIAVGPGGRVLCAAVLFEQPGVAVGLGEIATIVEWDGYAWRTIVPGDDWLAHGSGSWETASAPVSSLAYAHDGRVLAATARGVRTPAGVDPWARSVRALWMASDGSLFALTRVADQTELIQSRDDGRSWQPIVRQAGLVDATEGQPGVIYVAGKRLGRASGAEWFWTPWPSEFEPEHIAAHLRTRTVVAWGGGRIAVSLDGGISLPPIMMTPFHVAWVAVEPFEPQTLLVGDRSGLLYRVTF